MASATVTPIAIVARSIVGLLCYYKPPNVASGYADATGEIPFKGSGVIVSPDGYILTAKHLIDPQWENWAYASTTSVEQRDLNNAIQLDYCKVGLPETDNLPTPKEIKDINPSQALQGGMQYKATLSFEPPRGSMSDVEFRTADFALLKITAATPDCATFSRNCNDFGHFPYDPVLYSAVPQTGNELINYGYPVEMSADYTSQFFLKGAVGPLRDYYGGDAYFKNDFLQMLWQAEDLIPGRSGSPVFWNGYVVGVEIAGGGGQPLDEAVGMPAIYKVLKDNNLGGLLSTR